MAIEQKQSWLRGVPQIVVEIGPNDVLFGRGSQVNAHEGNKQFRELALARAVEYSTTDSNGIKEGIAKDIVDEVMKLGGRFLRPIIAESETGDALPAYEIVDEITANGKTKAKLRDFSAKLRKKLTGLQKPGDRAKVVRPVNHEQLQQLKVEKLLSNNTSAASHPAALPSVTRRQAPETQNESYLHSILQQSRATASLPSQRQIAVREERQILERLLEEQRRAQLTLLAELERRIPATTTNQINSGDLSTTLGSLGRLQSSATNSLGLRLAGLTSPGASIDALGALRNLRASALSEDSSDKAGLPPNYMNLKRWN